MFCEYCGSRNEHGAQVCESCGSELKASRPLGPPPVAVANAPDPMQMVMEGPTCAEHPGMPLLGNCPRCRKQVCVSCAPDAVSDRLTCNECYGLTDAHKVAPVGAVCALHPQKRAIFVCGRCGSFACASCKPTYDTSGRCAKCAGVQRPMASRGDRFVAAFVDGMAVWLLPLISIFVMLAAIDDKKAGDKDTVALIAVGLMGMFFFIGCGAQIGAQVIWGQSIGKRMTGIKVVRKDGSPIELWRLLLLRNIAINILSQACGLLPIIDILMIFTQDQRCLHDYLADSIVVDVDPKTGQ